jgi:hypothetical protein
VIEGKVRMLAAAGRRRVMRFVIGNDVGGPVGQTQDWPRGGISGFLYATRQSAAEAVAIAYKAEAERCGGAR